MPYPIYSTRRNIRKKQRLYKVYFKELLLSLIMTVSGTAVFIYTGYLCIDMIKKISSETTLPQFHSYNWSFIAVICLTVIFECVILDFIITFTMHIIFTIQKIDRTAKKGYDQFVNSLRKNKAEISQK